MIALEQGVLLAQEMELSQVMFESDVLNVIQAINEGNTGSAVGHLIQGILLARDTFTSCSFHHLKRDYNRVAHELTQNARQSNTTSLWKGVNPPMVSSLILLESL